MTQTESSSAIFMAQAAVVLIVGFVVLGVILYGVSSDVNARLWQDISQRPSGPMSFRFILQPTMAALAALHDGVRDARLGRDPYLWTVLSNPSERVGRVREALISTGRIILLGFGMDAIYQYTVLRTFYPGEMVVIAILLAFVPYVLLRGPFSRLAKLWMNRKAVRRAS